MTFTIMGPNSHYGSAVLEESDEKAGAKTLTQQQEGATWGIWEVPWKLQRSEL